MTKPVDHAFIPSPKSAIWNSGFRIIATKRGEAMESADMRLRFTRWQAASDYLDAIVLSDIVSSGRIYQHVNGIGWVLADTNPEDKSDDH